jgi:UDP-glucose 4-epimerase
VNSPAQSSADVPSSSPPQPFRTVLVTGGAGYIGSHTTVKLIEAGYRVVVVDNLCNSFPESLHAVREITGVEPIFECGDIADQPLIERLLREHAVDGVLHFAGYKAVGESNEKPLDYYENNVVGTLRLLQAMAAQDVRALVFSSSATVYGDPDRVPLDENSPTAARNCSWRRCCATSRPPTPHGASRCCDISTRWAPIPAA